MVADKSYNQKPINKKQTVKEIILIRIFLIIFLILYHSFCPAGDVWTAPENYSQIFSLYWWISRFTYYFLLETFVFISGWLYGIQIKKSNFTISISDTISKKIKRLIFPSILFSIIYLLIFTGIDFSFSSFYNIINGAGHLWFLPMLFWTFLISSVIESFHLNSKTGLLVCLILLSLSVFNLPFRLDTAFYYLSFFYCGIILGKTGIEKFRILKKIQTNGFYIIILALISLTLFVSIVYYTHIYDALAKTLPRVDRIILKFTFRYGKLLYSSSGVFLCLVVSSWLVHIKNVEIPDWLVNISKYCFGVYIYQQFILKIIYYNLNFIDYINYYILPWLGFIITLFFSLFLTWLTLKNRFGRLLIG